MSSSETDEEFIKYGTPLDILDEDEIPRKRPRFIEDQIVRDKQGRRRFHGAFTGGFSAGFFNTVGSIEGWKPSSFKSSKSRKQIFKCTKPEDYMDDEDTNEFGIAPVVLKAKETYKTQQSSFHEGSETNVESFLLNKILKPIRETVGLKLLAKMGWKLGQGIGPRASKREKQKFLQFQKKIYGCQPLINISDEEKEESEKSDDSKSKWADIDITYAPSDYELFLIPPKNNCFGIGYEGLTKNKILGFTSKKNDSLHFRLNKNSKNLKITGQAFGVGVFEEEDEDIYARDDLSQYDYILASDIIEEENRTLKKTTYHLDANDNVLDGFTLQLKKSVRPIYRLPIVPKNFKYHHQFQNLKFGKKKENIASGNRFPQISLGSEDLVRTTLKNQKENKSTMSSLPIFRDIKPDPVKQERFVNYLTKNDSKNEEESSETPLSFLTGRNTEKKKVEFEQSEKLLKPFMDRLENRFLPASQADDVSNPLAVVEKSFETNENKNCEEAARMKMFGLLTRNIEAWFPCSLIYKRFNVPEPEKWSAENCKKKGSRENNLCNFSQSSDLQESYNVKNQINETSEKISVSDKEKLEELNLDSDSKMDMFKAIFLSSDEDEKSNCGKEEIVAKENLLSAKKNDTFYPRLFEKIDFESLNESNKTARVTRKSSPSLLEASGMGLDPKEIYGPKIPEKLNQYSYKNNSFHNMNRSDDSNCWVEKKNKYKAKAKRQKKEKKSKKHKLKRKRKHKRH